MLLSVGTGACIQPLEPEIWSFSIGMAVDGEVLAHSAVNVEVREFGAEGACTGELVTAAAGPSTSAGWFTFDMDYLDSVRGRCVRLHVADPDAQFSADTVQFGNEFSSVPPDDHAGSPSDIYLYSWVDF